ncbi:nucleoside triphosphate pyrophosphohydrolase family protein [Candidatus Saccharibacteria bacterium]|jgi:NTP pyrophosphatase (non-canonical NTP hydrolase)|nr:nucleoside triphosphate pyrophosphohydrolase family protein [Candidatus Saccharibacteria bacterium]
MTLDDYQQASASTIVESDDSALFLARMTLGLVGESGEVAEKVKKILRDDNGQLTNETKSAIAAELGDVLWYLARLAELTDVSLDKVAQENLSKLTSRQKRNKISGSGDNR